MEKRSVKISGYGIQIEVPHGWEARVYKRPEGDPTLHAGNFPLPVDDGDFGGAAVGRMTDEGIFIALTEYRAEMAGQPLFGGPGLPLSLDGSELNPLALQRAISGQSGVQRFFTEAGRPFCIYVVVGNWPSPWKLVRQANRVLRTLSITSA
jgi:hypothetical protein